MGVGINSGSRPESTLDQITKGLTAARNVFGIAVDVEKISNLIKERSQIDQKNIKFEQDQRAYEQENNPDSNQSHRARVQEEAIIRALEKKGTLNKDSSSALMSSIHGSSNVGEKAIPPMSAAQITSGSRLKDLMGMAKSNQTSNNQRERQAATIHDRVITRLSRDPTLTRQLGQYQGLQNAMSMITQSDHITGEQFHEFQQAIRSSIGIKGTGGVDERAATYLKSLGLSVQNFSQFLTGEPKDMGKDHPFIKHITQLAHIEQKNILNNFNKRINAVTGGHSSLYEEFPNLKMDLHHAIGAVQGQIEIEPQKASNENSALPKVGEIYKGYRFKGGDPGDKNNWENP